MEDFNTDYKLLPPLRTKEDIKALVKGLKDGTIDGVTSDHNPIDQEHKKVEFEHAYFGSIGLESCFGALNKTLGLEATVKSLTSLKKVFQIEEKTIEEGQQADITLFNPDQKWKFTTNDILSTSKNSALLNVDLKGKPYGICANNQLILR